MRKFLGLSLALITSSLFSCSLPIDSGKNSNTKSDEVSKTASNSIDTVSNIDNSDIKTAVDSNVDLHITNSYTKVWEKTFGGDDWDKAYAITPTKDGGFVVAGVTYSFGNGEYDVYLIKIK